MDRRDKAFKYLVKTDEQMAKARALAMGLEDQKKTVKSIEFLRAEGTVAEREATAYVSRSYTDHIEKIENAVADYETLRNKRTSEILVIECWRSENANRRAGNI